MSRLVKESNELALRKFDREYFCDTEVAKKSIFNVTNNVWNCVDSSHIFEKMLTGQKLN